ncbi:MAG: hypothetical protein ABFD18_20385 [Syntrophomonas sp.]
MLDCRHMLNMTGEAGILQFSYSDKPDPGSGYTLDDNARALIVALHMENTYEYAQRYSRYLSLAQQTNGSWSNILLNGHYYSTFDSEDSIGRAILACSLAVDGPWPDITQNSLVILQKQLPQVLSFRSPRAVAYILIALCQGQVPLSDKQRLSFISNLLDKLINCYSICNGPNWHWFENYLTYCNGILPQAMFAVYSATGDKKALKTGHDSLNFLNSVLFKQDYLNIIGNQGWLPRGGQAAGFDQQPVDAASTAFANLEAYRAIGEVEYLELALLAYQWYRGRNIHGISLYDHDTGGCYDALTPDGVNLNQGAEAVISLLLTNILMKNFISQDVDVDLTC